MVVIACMFVCVISIKREYSQRRKVADNLLSIFSGLIESLLEYVCEFNYRTHQCFKFCMQCKVSFKKITERLCEGVY